MTWQITLEHRDDEHGLLHRSLTLREDGHLVLSGHDLGRGVSSVFGSGLTEYEFARTIDPAGVNRISGAMDLAGGSELRAAIEGRFGGPGGSRSFEQFLEDHEIASKFWNHIGD